MKIAAAEAGFDAALVERAARLVPPERASGSLFARIIGGEVRSEGSTSYSKRLEEDEAARLLSAIRSTAGHRGTGDASEAGVSWYSATDTGELVVTAHAEPDRTSVVASIDRRNGLVLAALFTGLGLLGSLLAAMAVAQETAISPLLVLASGSVGTLAVMRAAWAASTRRARTHLAAVMEAIDRSIRGSAPEPSAVPTVTAEPHKANLAEKLSQISEHWTPRLAAQVNETDVKLVKLQGEFVWHRHAAEDELFLILKGRLLMQFRDREEWIEEGEFILVPRGVEHRPVAPEEAHILLIEPAGTRNTGDARGDLTVDVVEPI